MRVGLLMDDSLDRTDGVQQHVLTLGRWLTGQGHEVHYVAPSTTRDDLPHLHQLGRGVPVRFNGNTLTTPALLPRHAARDLAHRLALDVLHVAMPYSPLLAGRVVDAVASSTAVVGTFHILPASPVVEVGTRALGAWQRRRLRRFDEVLAVSGVSARFARDAFGVDPQVVPNPVELTGFVAARAARERHDDEVRVAFLGRLVARKGVVELVDAVAHARRTAPPRRRFRVLIGGGGALHDQLVASVASAGLSGVVELVGRVPEDAKAAFLADADVVVLPSVAGESFGISVVEAFAACPGPVLVGDNPGYRELVGDLTATLVDPRDTAGFAAALTAVIDDPDPAPRAAAQQARAEVFDVERVGPQVVDAYRRALARRGVD